MIAGAVTSVIDLGAVGNGTTNDRVALAAAEAAGAGIYLPPGVYRISTSITLTKVVTFAPGAILKPDNGVTITLTGEIDAGLWQIFDTSAGGVFAGPARNQHIYPDWWGAVPNIPTNQSPKIQAAITFAQAGNRTVYLRNGLWRCDTTLRITEPAGIVGDPGNAFQSVTAANSALDFSNAAANVNGLEIGRTTDFPLDGGVVRDIAIFRAALPTTGSGATGLKLKSCGQVECINVMCWNWDVGFMVGGTALYPSAQCEFSGCRSQYAGTYHFDIWSAIDTTFDRCAAGGGPAAYCVFIYPNAGAVLPNALHFTNCVFVSADAQNGARILGGFWHTFQGCVFEEQNEAGILVSMPVQDLSLLNVAVTDCWFNGCATPFSSVGVGGNFRIENNRMENSFANIGLSALSIDSTQNVSAERDVVITGNILKVSGASQSGMFIQRISGARISGNKIYCVGAAAANAGIVLGSLATNTIVSENRSLTTFVDPGGISNNGTNNNLINNNKG